MRGPNIGSLNSDRTMPSPCSPLWLPLYSRTSAKHSSAIARIFATSAGSFMLSTGRTCRQPTLAWAYQVPLVPCLLEDVVQPLGVVGEVGQRDGAILDEGDRLPVALHAHHDVEPGLAHLGHRGLEAGIDAADHGAGIAEIGHHLVQRIEPPRAAAPSSSPWNSTISRLSGSPITMRSMVAR